MHDRRPTLTQVARRAGVSIASVSRALNNGPASAETIRRVRAAVAELGYVPDATARLLKHGHTPSIAFAAPDMTNPVYVEMMSAMEQVIRAEGYRLTITSAGTDAEGIADLVSDLGRGLADGLIISPLRVTPQLVQSLVAAAVPLAVIGRIGEETPLDCVQVDSATGIGLAVDHLVGMGLTDLLLLNGPIDTTPGRYRDAGFREAAKQAGLEPRPPLIAEDFTTEAGAAALATALEHGAPPQAIVAANDLLAVGAMRVLSDRGLLPGTDIAVVGMDDTYLADLVYPRLTSVSLRAADRARMAAQLLIARLHTPTLPPRQVTMTPSMTVRASSRCIARSLEPTR